VSTRSATRGTRAGAPSSASTRISSRPTGRFGSYDWNHRQVDEGTYRIVDADTVTIGDASFDFRIVGEAMTLSADIPPECSGTCLPTYEWATMVALPGTTFQRVH